MSKILPVILSGGSGTRLWPLSRAGYPKQFIALTSELSLYQETLKRSQQIENSLHPVVVCNNEHRFLIAEQSSQAKSKLSAIILEPCARNTAPAITLAAFHAETTTDDALILVLPSDHVITDQTAFNEAIKKAASLANDDYIVTFGINPTQAETGYGYIKAGKAISDTGFKIEQFTEKPNKDIAEEYLKQGCYFWNSGMFMFKASTYLAEIKKWNNEIHSTCEHAYENRITDLDFLRIGREDFERCPSDSIDYALMEKTEKAAVVTLSAGWNDVGSWPSVWDVSKKDNEKNATHGDVILEQARNNYVYAQSRLVCLLGVDNLTVVETPDAILVAQHDKAQDIKKIVECLKNKNRTEIELHRQVFRPWGSYDSVDEGSRFKVKRIVVKPGEKLSLQMHHHRAEHWIVVKGTANVTIEKTQSLVTENQSVYIPIGSIHCLENPGKVLLELIEVQTGSYLGEDDIVRIQDRYGRA